MSTHVSVKNVETIERIPVSEGASHFPHPQNSVGSSSRILWYRNDIGPRLSDETRALFETYSGISGEELIEHLHNVVSDISSPEKDRQGLGAAKISAERRSLATWPVSLYWTLGVPTFEFQPLSSLSRNSRASSPRCDTSRPGLRSRSRLAKISG